MDERTIWVWFCEYPMGFLFEGNPNPECPPFHSGDISNLLMGKKLVWGHTRWELENRTGFSKSEWKRKFPKYKILPKKVKFEIYPFVKETK